MSLARLDGGNDGIERDPVDVMECHRGRLIPQTVVREMLEAFGIQVCPRCHRFAGMTGRARVQWREPETVPVPVRNRTLPN
jgi:hypothetical protein